MKNGNGKKLVKIFDLMGRNCIKLGNGVKLVKTIDQMGEMA